MANLQDLGQKSPNELHAAESLMGLSGKAGNCSKLQMLIRKEIQEATLDEKKDLMLKIFSDLIMEERESKKAKLNFNSEMVHLEAEISKSRSAIEDSKARLATLNEALKDLKEKEASISASLIKKSVPNTNTLGSLDIMKKWFEKEALQLKHDIDFVGQLKTEIKRHIAAKEAEYLVLLFELEIEMNSLSEELKTLRAEQAEREKALDLCKVTANHFMKRGDQAAEDIKMKAKKIKSMANKQVEWLREVNGRVNELRDCFVGMGLSIQDKVEAVEETFGSWEATCEKNLLPKKTKLLESSQVIQSLMTEIRQWRLEDMESEFDLKL